MTVEQSAAAPEAAAEGDQLSLDTAAARNLATLSVRFMGVEDKAVTHYPVSAYYSAAVLVPDALGVLENVEIARPRG